MTTPIRDVAITNGSADNMVMGAVAANTNYCTTPGPSDNSTRVPNTSWVRNLLSGSFLSVSLVNKEANLFGLYIKWGETPSFDTGPTSISFVSAFPTNCFQVLMTDSYDDGNVNGRIWMVASITRFGFQCRNNGTGSGKWLAIGN